jgi:taurine dioxygenase
MSDTQPLPGNFGVEVLGADVVGMSDEVLRLLLLDLYSNRITVVRAGDLTEVQYIDFARRIGDPLLLIPNKDKYPEIIPVDNLSEDIQETKHSAAHWHTDQSFTSPLASVTMLYSLAAPCVGGETHFCDMAEAYDTLSESTKSEIDELEVVHRRGVSIVAREGEHAPPILKNWDYRTVYHPLVRQHPITGCKTLYAISGSSQGIRGMSESAAKRLLESLCKHALAPRFLTSHRHRVGDILMWDNPTTMHTASPIGRASGPDDTRVLWRISLKGVPSVFPDHLGERRVPQNSEPVNIIR